MSINEPTITVHGHLTDRPSLRFLNSGTPVAELTVAQNPRYRSGDGWTDGEPVFLRCKAWRDLAESVCESLNKGDRVTVVGRLRRRTWEDRETGARRWLDEVEADDVAASCRGQHLRISKLTRERPAARNDDEQAAELEPDPEEEAAS